MTIRRYYDDATTVEFEATVVERTSYESRPAVVLDETCFYPTSGGQPHDVGHITDGRTTANIVDVIADAPDSPVIHVLDRKWEGESRITANVDWSRRFDHMQQHTGQHILSQAFIRVAEAETVGFHLSAQTVTIDLDTADLSTAQLARVEQLSNDVVWSNAPVVISRVSPEAAVKLPLRKIPTRHDGQIRLVAVGDFDLSACGGTHVAATGQVGMIKIIRTERRGELTRVEFCCGQRALDDYGRKNAILQQLGANLTTGLDDLVDAVSRQQEDAREWRSQALALDKELTRREAEQLWASAAPTGNVQIVRAVLQDREPESVRRIAGHLIEHERTIALLGLVTPERTHLIFGRSADAPGHMGELLRDTISRIEGAKGGGSPTMAQGGAPAMDASALGEILQQAAEQLRKATKGVE